MADLRAQCETFRNKASKKAEKLKIEIQEQEKMIRKCFFSIHEWNPTTLRGLLIPEPMLEQPLANKMWERGPSEAAVTIR